MLYACDIKHTNLLNIGLAKLLAHYILEQLVPPAGRPHAFPASLAVLRRFRLVPMLEPAPSLFPTGGPLLLSVAASAAPDLLAPAPVAPACHRLLAIKAGAVPAAAGQV